MDKHRVATVIAAGVAAMSLAVVGAGTAVAADSDNADHIDHDKRHTVSRSTPSLPISTDLLGLDVVTNTVNGLLGGALGGL